MKDASGKGTRTSFDGAYVALLRGINVGGKNMLPMKDLVALCSEAGCSSVESYIQSGKLGVSGGVRACSSGPADARPEKGRKG